MIIQRYLFREVGQSFGAVLIVLLLIYVSFRFVRFFAEAAAGKLASNAIFELVGLKLVVNLAILIPLALYVAVLLALGRLHRDSEIVAMTAGGYGVTKVAVSVLWLALSFGALSAGLSLYLAPALSQMAAVMTKEARSSTHIGGVFPGRFKEYGPGDRVFYVETIHEDRRSMSNVFVQIRDKERLDVVFAERARHEIDADTGNRFMVMENGRQYQGQPGEANYAMTQFERYAVRLETGVQDREYRKPEAMPTSELLLSDKLWHIAELQWRLSLPISTVLLTMFAVPLAHTVPGQGRALKLFTGVLVYFVYNNLLTVAYKSVESGALAPDIGVWIVHFGLALIVLVMIVQQQRYGLLTPRWIVMPGRWIRGSVARTLALFKRT
jgi:lipopolysaccharide export system permease protein